MWKWSPTALAWTSASAATFLNAGLGYGGSCFPKDVKAFIAISKQLGTPFKLLEEVERINAAQLARFIDKVRNELWVLKDKKLAVWGLTFKPDTDDVRNSGRHRAREQARRRGRTRHRLRSERFRESGRVEPHRSHEGQARADGARSAGRCRGADPRHGMEGIRECRFRRSEAAHAHPARLRRTQSFRPRDDAPVRLHLSRRGAARARRKPTPTETPSEQAPFGHRRALFFSLGETLDSPTLRPCP